MALRPQRGRHTLHRLAPVRVTPARSVPPAFAGLPALYPTPGIPRSAGTGLAPTSAITHTVQRCVPVVTRSQNDWLSSAPSTIDPCVKTASIRWLCTWELTPSARPLSGGWAARVAGRREPIRSKAPQTGAACRPGLCCIGGNSAHYSR